jgi:SAM-dependent methyltransferase
VRRDLPSPATPAATRAGRLLRWSRERGVAWTLLWCLRAVAWRLHRRLLALLEARLAAIERRRFLLAPDTVSVSSNTVERNRELWSGWDWSRLGEEWTEDVAAFRGLDPATWKRGVVERFLIANARKGGVTLEIGPGAGRWTEHLLEVSLELHLADLSERCLQLCRDRFAGSPRIACHLVAGDGRLDFLPDASVDFIWSYDVFVHVSPVDTDRYLAEFARILRPGARAVIHHADRYDSHAERAAHFRSNLSREFFAELCRRRGLRILAQDRDHAHKRGDCISVIEAG